MLVMVIFSCLIYFPLLERYFCDLFGTASAFDFTKEREFGHSQCNICMRSVRITAGDMSLNVSLPSIGCPNEWFLIARLMVSCLIRVMNTVLNTNKLK
jgi:hypothetical protein